ncbi:hypothetical protein QQ045_033150 [Rhodiola kirilowii]
MDEWLLREELLWKHRSRADWLREGDLNTKYFHARVSQRLRTNRIKRLRGTDGRWLTDEREILSRVSDYFRDLFRKGASVADICWDLEM